ncbi:hypothetical protein ACE1ET_09400 [Saccharicrinis sp. FJH62]|uniref:DUF7151 family protein n=1 Tax=Saccharicrinis sp. FJH62 TaxID=3344657 RepID=UPI0035D3FC33
MKIKFLLSLVIFIILLGCNKSGLDGSNSLIDFKREPIGENCSSGGYKVSSGIDLNGNNILDDDEILTVEYICNGDDGTNGTNGYNSLLNIIQEPIGDFCSAGGYKIMSGIDYNQNNILDSVEIQNIEYACNGEPQKLEFKNYVSLISQTGTNNPTSKVLQNTLDINISWIRLSLGTYVGTLDSPININKTILLFSTPMTHTGVRGQIISATQVRIQLQAGINAFRDNFSNLSFEIRQFE